MTDPVFWAFYGKIAPLILLFMGGLWLLSLRLGKVSFIDSAWGASFILLAAGLYQARLGTELGTAQALGLMCLVLWGARLSLHLGLRFKRDGEDRRYQAILDKPQKIPRPLYSLLFIFSLQGFLILVVASPLVALMAAPPQALDGLALLGGILWLFGFLYETLADYQLMRFKQDPANKNKVCQQGLWRYSRHPNYLGEMLLWWGLWLISFQSGLFITVLSPLFVSLTLLKWSGIPLSEAGIHKHRPAYLDYKRHTNAIFPYPPRHYPPRHYPPRH